MKLHYPNIVIGNSIKSIIFAANNDYPIIVPVEEERIYDALDRFDLDFDLSFVNQTNRTIKTLSVCGKKEEECSEWTNDMLKTLFLLPLGLRGLLPFHRGQYFQESLKMIPFISIKDKTLTVLRGKKTHVATFDKIHIVDYEMNEGSKIARIDYDSLILARDLWIASRHEKKKTDDYLHVFEDSSITRVVFVSSNYCTFIVESKMHLTEVDTADNLPHLVFQEALPQMDMPRLSMSNCSFYKRKIIKNINNITSLSPHVQIHEVDCLNESSDTLKLLRKMYDTGKESLVATRGSKWVHDTNSLSNPSPESI